MYNKTFDKNNKNKKTPFVVCFFLENKWRNELFSSNLHGEEEYIINPIYGNASVEKTKYIWCDVTPPPWGLTPNIQP